MTPDEIYDALYKIREYLIYDKDMWRKLLGRDGGTPCVFKIKVGPLSVEFRAMECSVVSGRYLARFYRDGNETYSMEFRTQWYPLTTQYMIEDIFARLFDEVEKTGFPAAGPVSFEVKTITE